MDELDQKLLVLLAQDGRISSAELARRVGAQERTVANRVNNLLSSGAISIKGVIKQKYFGYSVAADIFCKVESSDLNAVAQKIAEFPEVCYVAISFGEQDVSVQVVAKSTADLYEFVSETLARLPGVTRTNTVIVPRVIKDIHEWIPPEFMEDNVQSESVDE